MDIEVEAVQRWPGSNEITKQEQMLHDDEMRAAIAKLAADTAKIINENRFYPFVTG